RVLFKIDRVETVRAEYTREGNKPFHYHADRDWQPGEHAFTFEVEPLTAGTNRVRSLTVRIDQLTIRGPQEEKFLVHPRNYGQFFTKDPPKGAAERREWARQILKQFATKEY